MRCVTIVVVVLVLALHVSVSNGELFVYQISGTLDEGG